MSIPYKMLHECLGGPVHLHHEGLLAAPSHIRVLGQEAVRVPDAARVRWSERMRTGTMQKAYLMAMVAIEIGIASRRNVI